MTTMSKNLRTGKAPLMIRVLNAHSKNCAPERVGWRWKIERDNYHELIPFHKRSFWGDMRGNGYSFVLLRCNSTPGCPASALMRIDDFELAVENLLD